MYGLEDLLNDVVTIKLVSGVELIGKMIAYVKKDKFVTLQTPQTVIIADEDLAVIPFCYTGQIDQVTFSLDNVLAIVKSTEKSTQDYLELLKSTEEVDK